MLRAHQQENRMSKVRTRIRNGVDSEQLFATLNILKMEPDLAEFQFRALNRWIHGAHSRTTIRDFYGAGEEDRSRTESFVLDAGEPTVLLGHDTGESPAEHVLHALAACLTTSLVYAAAARGIHLTEVESRLDAEIDMRGALGLSENVPNSFKAIRVALTVKGEGPDVDLRALVDRARERSVVYDMLSKAVPVVVEVSTE
jgi:uncharacterized OsmC-like protein